MTADKLPESEVTRFIPGIHCPNCQGLGQTRATATETRRDTKGVYTHKQGSGCPTCEGTGRV